MFIAGGRTYMCEHRCWWLLTMDLILKLNLHSSIMSNQDPNHLVQEKRASRSSNPSGRERVPRGSDWARKFTFLGEHCWALPHSQNVRMPNTRWLSHLSTGLNGWTPFWRRSGPTLAAGCNRFLADIIISPPTKTSHYFSPTYITHPPLFCAISNKGWRSTLICVATIVCSSAGC